MRTRRTSPSPDSALPAREPFESPALYDLVAALSVPSYEDLLAPHWMVPDRAAGEEVLARERFTRRRSKTSARAAMTLHADGSRLTGRGRHRHDPVFLTGLGSWQPGAADAGSHPGPSAARARTLLARTRRGLDACAAWLRRLLARGRW
jgi:hypothetical protein